MAVRHAAQHVLSSLTPTDFVFIAVAAWVLYTAQLAFRRLYLSPISHIPGPRLAALTQYYESYYDIILGGQYTFKIIELHRKYGPIVRISPWEVHVNDPSFYTQLYMGQGRRRDKWLFYTQQVSSRPKPFSFF